ncbi:MAG: hypothetical protein HY763_13055, partial [Planctomycetes bacterium]|nr:hypothetical protein [Planctomycetota bacterium]
MTARRSWTPGALAGLVLGLVGSPAGAEIIYVDADAVGPAHDGASWCTAFTDLQEGLRAAAESGGAITEVRVANGVYRPDSGSGDRTASFQLLSGVSIRGGYAGCGARDPNWRDYQRFETVLSGDLNGDDSGIDCAVGSDCCVPHLGAGCDDDVCAQRICALGGSYAWCCEPGPPWGDPGWSANCARIARLVCCDFGENRCDNSYHVVTAEAVDAGAVLEGFTVSRGFANDVRRFPAPYIDARGAAILLRNAAPTILDCRLTQNAAETAAAAYLEDSVGATFAYCEFTGNYARATSVLSTDDSLLLLDGCWLHGNDALLETVRVDGSPVGSYGGTFRDCTLGPNLERDGIASSGYADIRLETCELSDYIVGAAVRTGTNDRLTVEDSVFARNSVGVRLDFTSATLRGSRFVRNGFGLFVSFAAAEVTDSVFVHGNGGWAQLFTADSYLRLERVTVALNQSLSWIAGLYVRDSTADVRSSILWGNTSSIQGEISEIDVNRGTLNIDYSIVEGWTGALGGVGNSGDDPLFVDPDGPDDIPGNEDDDFRLRAGSPGINAGDPDYAPEPGDVDLDGHPRRLCGRVDLGAYEFGIGDFDCDGSVGPSDLADWAGCCNGPGKKSVASGCEAFDFNADTDVDLADFAGFVR